MKKIFTTGIIFLCMIVISYRTVAQGYVDFPHGLYYTEANNVLTSSSSTLWDDAFSYPNTTHPLVNNGMFFPVVDYLDRNLWLRVRHIDDPNYPSTVFSWWSGQTNSSDLFGGYSGFLYQFDVYKDINITGARGNVLDGLFNTSILLESKETLSHAERVDINIINNTKTNAYWVLHSINFTGNNPDSHPLYSPGNEHSSYSSTFPDGNKSISVKSEAPAFSEFRVSANNLSQFTYGYAYDPSGYQGIVLKIGIEPTVATCEPEPEVPTSVSTDDADNKICYGTGITLTAHGTPLNNNENYEWYEGGCGTGNIISTDAALTVTPSIGTHNYYVRVKDNCGNYTTCTSSTVNVLVSPSLVFINTDAGYSDICTGTPITFSVAATNPGANPIYQWNVNGVNVGGNAPTFVSANLSTNDVVNCSVSNGICPVVNSNNITMPEIFNGPVTPSVNIAASPGAACAGVPVTFTATPVKGGKTPAYQWKLNGNDAGGNTATYTITSPSGGDVVSCAMTSSIPCSDPAVANSNSITVKAPVTFNAGIAQEASSICANGTLNFHVIIFSGGGTNPAYQWKLNGHNVGNNSDSYTQTGFVNNDRITCTIASSEPCASPASITTGAATISVYDVSNPSLSIVGTSNYCIGTYASFNTTVYNAGQHPAYQWKKNGINVGNDPFYGDNSLISGDVIACELITDPVCGPQVTVQSINSITITAITPATPAISIAAANPLASLSNNFTATITDGGIAPVYMWEKNGIAVGTNSNSYLDLSLAYGDVITCTLTNNASCASTAVSNALTVATLTYCIPFSIADLSSCDYSWISNVQLGSTINNTSGCDDIYADFTSNILETTAGKTIHFSVSEGSSEINYASKVTIFIDYNQNGDFDDDGENVASNLDMDLFVKAEGSFTIPASLAPGDYRIRVFSNNDESSSCETISGEAEDYTLRITQLVYCVPVINQPCDMWIGNVTIGSINNNSVQPVDCSAGGYTDYSSVLSTSAAPGQAVSFSLSGYGSADQYADIYIDYNANGDFEDAGEKVAGNLYLPSDGTVLPGSFVIPGIQPFGLYRMRVKTYSQLESQTGPCGNNTNGETEDYMLKIVNCLPNGSDIMVGGNNTDIADGDNTPDQDDFSDFGNVELNTTFARTFIIKNNGTGTLNISGVTLSGVNSYLYNVTSQPATSLAAGAGTTFTVRFSPPAEPGLYAGVVMHINNDNCDKKDYDIAIQGTAACPVNGPEINLQGNNIDITQSDYAPSLADGTEFGTATSNTIISKTYTIQNPGSQPLNISGIQMFNNDVPPQFDITVQPASTVAPGGSTNFTVTFSPAGSGLRTAFVGIGNDDCDEAYYIFAIEGTAECTGLAPEINVKGSGTGFPDGNSSTSGADNTDFGVVAIGGSGIKTFTIENTGPDPLHISAIDFSGANAAAFSLATVPAAIVAPGGSTTFSVRFSPLITGAEIAIAHIHNDDCDEGDYDFALKGTDGTPCVPDFGNACSYVFISKVNLNDGNINNTSGCSGGYADYSGTISTTVQPGATVNFSITNGASSGQNISIYADLNADGDFDDEGEQLTDLVYSDGEASATGSFNIPLSQPHGHYRLRVVSEYFGYGSTEPCHSVNGEIEDYGLIIGNGCLPNTSTTSYVACDSYTWNGTTYTTSGTYTYNTLNVAGCDSTATLTLTINHSTTSTTTINACNSYTWHGITHTTPGTYTYLTTNLSGCDSLATLLLFIFTTKPATPGAISGPTNACPYLGINGGAAATYSIAPVTNATGYNWTVPAGAAITSALPYTNSITVTFSASFVSGNVAVQATGPCGNSASKTLAVTKALPATPGTITGPTNVCPNIGGPDVTYSITAVTNATSYNWTVPAGATITSAPPYTTSVNVSFSSSFTSGNISVQSLSNCGSSGLRNLALTKTLPGTPGTITGPTNVCPNIGGPDVTYSIAPVTNATSYNWTVPAGATITSAPPYTTSINVSFSSSFTSGNISVQSVNNCATSGLRNLALTKTLPGTPGTITGPTNVCPNIGGPDVTYSIASVPNATGYNWTVPAGATITSAPPYTTSINVSFSSSFTSGNISVQSVNNCATSSLRNVALTKTLPGTPGTITGPTNVCPNIGGPDVTYSIAPVANATGYNWTVPVGATITSAPPYTTSINVSFSSSFTSGNISVQSVNNCATSGLRNLALTKTLPGTPGTITGPTNVCPNIGGPDVTYSIASVPNATGYNWTVPAGATITSAPPYTTSINVSFSSSFIPGNISVQSLSNCGSSGLRNVALTKTLPGTPGTITGPTNVCPNIGGQDVTYSIASVPNATGYNWTVPAGATITSAPPYTTLINVSFSSSFTSGNISVQSVNNCATSTFKNLALTKSLPGTPGTITGPTDPCPLIGISDATYTIRKVLYATSYTWAVPPAGATISGHPGGTGINDTIITVTFDNTVSTGNISVIANNNCASSAPRNLALLRKLPAIPGTITSAVASSTCPNRQYTYSIPSMPVNATSISWTAPAGGTIISQGALSVTIMYGTGAVSDTLRVAGVNNCVNSAQKKLKITLPACPPGPGFTTSPAITESLITKHVPSNTNELYVNIFPNPSERDFKLQVTSSNDQKIHVRVLDIVGREFRKFTMMRGETLKFGDDLKHGSYIIEIQQGNNSVVRKVLKF